MKFNVKKVIGIALLAFLLLFVTAITCLWTMFPPEKIKQMVIPEIEKALSRKVAVEKAGFSIFPTIGVSLSGVEISNTTRPEFLSTPFVKIDRFIIQISFASIFKGHPDISKVVIRNPQIFIEANNTGSFNYDDMPVLAKDTAQKKKSAMPVLPVPVSLRSFEIEHGSVTYIDDKSQQQFIVGDINQKVKLDVDKELKDVKTTGHLVLGRISVKTKEIKKPLSNITITLNHTIKADLVSGNVSIDQFRVSFQKISFNLTGNIRNLNEKPVYDLAIKSDTIQIEDLLSEIPADIVPEIAKITGSGEAIANLTIKGEANDSGSLPINGNLKLNNVMAKYTDLPKSVNNLNGNIKFTDSSIFIDSVKMNLGDNPIQLHASVVNFKHPFVDLAILAKINLGDIKGVIELPKGVALSGKTDIDVKAKGIADPSDPAKLDVKGSVDLADVAVRYPPLVKPAIINGRFTLSSKAIGQNISVKIGKSSLKMAAAISNYLSLVFADSTKNLPRPNAEFTLTSPFLNVDEFMPQTRDTASVSKSEQTKPKKNVPLIAPLPGVDMKGTVSASKIIYQGVQMDKLDMKVLVVKDVADVDIRTGFSKGTIAENIHADLRNTKNISFNNKLTVTDVEINDLLRNFGGFVQPTTALNRELVHLQENLYGKVSASSNISGHGGNQDAITNSLNGDISVKVEEGKIVNSRILHSISGIVEKFVKVGDLEFHDMNAQMHIENEQVHFNKFQIASNLGDWDILGTVGFNSALQMEILHKLSKETSGKILSVQNAGKSLARGFLKAARLNSMASSLDDAGIPSDKDGRVTLKMALGGTTSNPKASFKGFSSGISKGENKEKVESASQKHASASTKDDVIQKKDSVVQKVHEEKTSVEEKLKKEVGKLKSFFK